MPLDVQWWLANLIRRHNHKSTTEKCSVQFGLRIWCSRALIAEDFKTAPARVDRVPLFSSCHALLEHSRVRNRTPVFSRGRLLPRVGRTDVQWSQIRFNGSAPRMVGSSWRSFPVWRRLANRSSNCPVRLCGSRMSPFPHGNSSATVHCCAYSSEACCRELVRTQQNFFGLMSYLSVSVSARHTSEFY